APIKLRTHENLSPENVKHEINSTSFNEDSEIPENVNNSLFLNSNLTVGSDQFDEEDIFKQSFEDNSFNLLVNEENEIVNENISIIDLQQADSPILDIQLQNGHASGSEETFYRIFNISPEDDNYKEQRHDTAFDLNNTLNDQPQSLNNLFEVYDFSNHTNKNNKTLADHIEEIFFNKLPTIGEVKNKSQSVPEEDDISDVEPINIRRGDIDREEEYGDEDEQDENEVLTQFELRNEIPTQTNEDKNEIPNQINEETNEITTQVTKIDEHEEEEVNPIQNGTTLAIVFDITGSMHDDLMQVRKGAERIMAAMSERPDNPIHNYVLVPFHDP
ncbi:hypothetical protein L9F63_006688, partial [Diploptera punctata]